MISGHKRSKFRRLGYGLLGMILSVKCMAQKEIPILENASAYDNYPTFSLINTRPDSASIKRLLKRADSLSSISPDSTRYLATLAYQQSKHLNFGYGLSHALNTLGMYMQNKGKYDSAISLFRQSIACIEKLPNKDQLFKPYVNIGTIHFYKGEYEKALDNYYRALDKIGNKNRKIKPQDSVRVYCNIGLLWSRMGERKQSLQALNIAKDISIRNRDSIGLTFTYNNFGGAYLRENNLGEALKYFELSLSLSDKYKMKGEQISTLNTLAHIYIERKQPDKAMEYTQSAMEVLSKYPEAFNYDRLHMQHNLGCIYLLQGDYQKASPLLLSALEQARKIDLKDFIAHIEPDIAAMYEQTGDYQKAYEHMLSYAELKDSILEQEKARSLDIWMKSRMDAKNKELIAKQLHISQQQNQIQSKNFWIGGTIFGSLLLCSLLIASIRSYRNKQRLQLSTINQLQQEQEINQLKAQVRGEEQERNRLARELHDGIASQLWAIKLNVDSLQQQERLDSIQQQRLHAIYQQLDDTTHDVRKTAHNLMPDLLLEEGLPVALASLCEKISKSTPLEVDFLEYGTIPRLDADIELSLYRMIQELIQNVLKHAVNATQLLVQISCTDMLLNVTVEDNGSGFTHDETNHGVGLHQIQKRVETLRGHIDVQSSPGRGTTIYLEFDIQQLL